MGRRVDPRFRRQPEPIPDVQIELLPDTPPAAAPAPTQPPPPAASPAPSAAPSPFGDFLAYQQARDYAQAQQQASLAWTLAVVGLFLFGPVLGIISLIQSSQARSMGVRTTSETLAWIDIILPLLGLIIWFGFIPLVMTIGSCAAMGAAVNP